MKDFDELNELICRGSDVSKVFEQAQEWLEYNREHPEEQVKTLTWFQDRGLSQAIIKEWLEKNSTCYMDEYVIESMPDFYEKYGVVREGMIERWLDRYGDEYFNVSGKLSELPKAIGVEKLISFFSMKEILDYCSCPYDFSYFVDEYVENGNDINVLAAKFMDEIGYPSDCDSDEYSALLDLVYAGASAEIIDPTRVLS